LQPTQCTGLIWRLFRGLNYNQAEIPDDILKQLELSLLHDKGCAAAHGKSEGERLRNWLGQVRSHIEQAPEILVASHLKTISPPWAASTVSLRREDITIVSR
jgi:hypothetical protein